MIEYRKLMESQTGSRWETKVSLNGKEFLIVSYDHMRSLKEFLSYLALILKDATPGVDIFKR